MAAYLDSVRSSLEMSIDFQGQRQAETYTQIILIVSAIIAFLAGFVLQDLRITLGIYAVGFVLTLAVVIPPWSMYKRHPIAWLAPQSPAQGDSKKTL